MNCGKPLTVLLIVLVLPVLGCSAEQEGRPPDGSQTPAAAVAAAGQTAPVPTSPVAAKPPGSPAAAVAQPARSPTASKAPADQKNDAAFEPPYPTRTDPFRRPDFGKQSGGKRQERPGVSEVVLKGFVNVAGVQALLAIDGQLAALSEGDQRDDLQVVGVEPPQVILQRGRLRWTETLYEK